MEQTRINVPLGGEPSPFSGARASDDLGRDICLDERSDGAATGRERRVMTEWAVRSILNRRRTRDRFFGENLFADPAWDILLELYAAELGQRRIFASKVCASASVPATTALRWINLLESKGFVRRKPDPFDGRRTFLSLSASAVAAMEDYFATTYPDPTIC